MRKVRKARKTRRTRLGSRGEARAPEQPLSLRTWSLLHVKAVAAAFADSPLAARPVLADALKRRVLALLGPTPAGLKLAVGGGALAIVCARTGVVEREYAPETFRGRNVYIKCVAWSPDGTQLAAGRTDGELRLLDAWSGAVQQDVTHDGIVFAASWHPLAARRALATGASDGKVRIIDAASGVVEHAASLGGLVYSVAFHPSGAYVAAGCWDGSVRFVDAESGVVTGQVAASERYGGAIFDLAWSPSGEHLALGSGHTGCGQCAVLHVASGAVERVLAHGGSVHSVAWHPRTAQLATASFDRSLRIFTAAGPKAAERRCNLGGRCFAAAWHPAGTHVVTGSEAGEAGAEDVHGRASIVDAATGECVRVIPVQGNGVAAVAWSP